MKYDVLDTKGNKIEQMELSDSLFAVPMNKDIVAQYIRVFSANQRQGTSSTKTRGDVSGGGKKPWRQKGTGRARVGSSRNPLWRHGGVAHGPSPKDWSLSMPQKMRQKALAVSLSNKITTKDLTVLTDIKMEKPKTKAFLEILKALDITKKVLLVVSKSDVNVVKSTQNLKNVKLALADNLNAYDLVKTKKVMFLKDAVLELQNKYEA